MSRIPEHMIPSVTLWVERGLPHPSDMGSFFRAVLCHDLMGAAMHADAANRSALADWAMYLHNELPHKAHGSAEQLAEWHANGGLQGVPSVAEPDSIHDEPTNPIVRIVHLSPEEH